MNRSYPAKTAYNRLHPQELSRRTAIHEAGHAAAIYLGNKQKQLPPVFFQIVIKEPNNELPVHGCYYASRTNHFAQVEGGRLIHTLPSSIQEAFHYFPAAEKPAYQCAFEADIINLLVGPLAEAKYVALSDDEPINPRLVNLDSLHYYGGASDLKTVREYLDCWLDDPARKEKKIFELFLAAYDFINDQSNWNAITALADYIVKTGKKIIDCEEAINILDAKKSA